MSDVPRPAHWDAPEGTLYICGDCGKNGEKRDELGGNCCFSNAVLCHDYPEMFTWRDGKIVAGAIAVTNEHWLGGVRR